MKAEGGTLTVQGLATGYPRRPVIADLAFPEIVPGERVALVGPNAAGKSTLLRAIAGLIPARGSVQLGGRELLRLTPRERAALVAFMPQAMPAGIGLSVAEGVTAALRASPIGTGGGVAAATRAPAFAVLERLGILDLALEPIDRLSGGQRQLVSLAQTIVRNPHLVLLDEPTSALDLRHQLEVMAVAADLAREGRIVLFVLHDLNAAARHADRIAVLAHGGLVHFGPPEEALTPERLAEVYGVAARIERCSKGTLRVIADEPLGMEKGFRQ